MWKKLKKLLLIILIVFVGFSIWVANKKPKLDGDWQEQLKVLATAKFNGDLVTVENVRNFRYGSSEDDMKPAYYSRTYDLSKIKKVWYVTEPFMKVAGHTFLSFEFENGDFLAITIEARKTKNQVYSIFKGLFNTYPLIYIPADERDVILLRANLRKDNVYIYPVKLSKPENAKLLLTDLLETMNEINTEPIWYNTIWSNCTSSIAKHVNKISPRRVSLFSWQLWFTAYADKLALKAGLLDTGLNIDQAREKYLITLRSQQIGDVSNYSSLIRNFK